MNEYISSIDTPEELSKYVQMEKDERRNNNKLKGLETCTKIVTIHINY
jgi:hypothetical protein